MAEVMEELRKVKYSSFDNIFQRFNALQAEYGDLPAESLFSAFGMYSGGYYSNNPFVQNRRVKKIGTSPISFDKDDVSRMLLRPQENELPLRQAAHELDYTSYTFHHIRRTYTAMLTYHNYIAPEMVEPDDMGKEFWREYKLLEKARKLLDPARLAEEASGKVQMEGKVFYTYRVNADKSHNKVNHAFYQQLPSDYVKIVGFNNKSKYTLAFNMMYFLQPGADIRQFPKELFAPYWNDFNSAVTPAPKNVGGKLVYASNSQIDMERMKASRTDAEVYYQNGRWFYWVVLPVEKAHTIEADDAIAEVIPPFTGLFINFINFSKLLDLQLSLYQNPLIGFVHGEIPYFDTKETNTADQYKLSNAGRMFFTALWNELMAANNTAGIPFWAGPFQNIKLESFNEVQGTSEIVSQGNKDTITQAGLSGIIPASDEARAGAVQVSLQIEGKFLKPVYSGVERLMNCMISDLNPTYDWVFHMFGDLYSDAELEKKITGDMTLGILPATIIYNALHDRSILDDICWSGMIEKSGLLDLRIPLVSSYSAKQGESGLPPQAKHDMNPGGRPESDGITSEGQEADSDASL